MKYVKDVLSIILVLVFLLLSVEASVVKFGYITDIHHNDIGRRAGCCVRSLYDVIAYLDTLDLEFIIHGGDFLDINTSPENALDELKKIEGVFQSSKHHGYHILGNHERGYSRSGVSLVPPLPADKFIEYTSMEKEYYYREYGNIRFLFLNINPDALYPDQLGWIEKSIAETDKNIVIFTHYPIAGRAGSVRPLANMLQDYGERVIASFSGHVSRVTNTVDYTDGILHYSMAHFFHRVPTFAVIEISEKDGKIKHIKVKGFGAQQTFITPPCIQLKGPNLLEIPKGEEFLDPGATAVTAIDGDLTEKIVVQGEVNTGIAGTYELIYRLTDMTGNTVKKTRLIRVIAPD